MLIQNVIVELRSVAIRINKDVLSKRDKLVDARICLVCEEPLGDRPSRRGECPTCRQYTTRKIERGLMLPLADNPNPTEFDEVVSQLDQQEVGLLAAAAKAGAQTARKKRKQSKSN